MARFIDQIEDYIKQLQSTGLDDAPIFFNDFQTMTVGGLLADMLKFYPSSAHSSQVLSDKEELKLAENFTKLITLLESKRPKGNEPVVSKELNKAINLFFEQVDSVFSKLYDRDGSKLMFDPVYFKDSYVRGLMATGVLEALKKDK
ncbi:MAG: hypothetical protein A2600_09345 [Candidatus Lambdaproteobacteria bacterium RIFOXYD1_FULL_56_27]|uniref:Uncharacterized protein n=1 Tax=Candidatus Lambdaproteobacteria bacterium RIFOXYD2_FULL_56_26 TaxID=1817773 RepID=A0A1F6GUU1_9PROT|nr:MAG: hypothetical protein A2557_04615 [Candidatus Lambdaproteobacteria bacterium RIFOXYD2_FULL_56_26]OGH02258.1 MAG: hypothetical protein A2426_03095 [Candidatus Lambdaproteobacteria bacterium RIFOXYC1_FULL_56_13]OGH10027.1 MAG: hypothetical protein A2600_09345 [Candidatus Lambdaproteobacteria bacterium RIFOXYD1_FULL_56_27]